MKRLSFLLYIILLILGNTALGWWPAGHSILTQAAVKSLPEEMPQFFRMGEGMIAHCSFDPDVSRNRGTPLVRNAESPEHYLDRELLKGHALPKNRYDFIQLCAELEIKPENVGLLPYAVAEWTERLAVAFAEHRKWEDNPFIKNKCLVYAGFIAHYAQDMCQPLHLTVHYDGRVKEDGSSPHTGIHAKVDGLIQYLALKPEALVHQQEVVPFSQLMNHILKEFEKTYSLVDLVYELEDKLPSFGDEDWKPAPEVIDFANKRTREAVRFTASLYLTAWKLSENIELDSWLNRAKSDQNYIR